MRYETLKRILSEDKRKTDRLTSPVLVSYQLPFNAQWSKPTVANDISASGLKFTDSCEITPWTDITVSLRLYNNQNPITVRTTVAWCQKQSNGMFTKGIRFSIMDPNNRREYLRFIFNELLGHNAHRIHA
ncbi:MAG TPA: PilZ domain-containing protein [Candidatus Omnitrophota bacterium]|nr:PilZ domain-containing protein [Candidatus Omnitrophota bacterium]HPT08006.1 PilZ domain-containing protein [Candidatus Omnitrophota bacterium]